MADINLPDIILADGLVLEDGWYAVQRLDETTYAIGEPAYYQQNWSYLLIGNERSLLFDTGSFSRDISGVAARLTDKPLTAMPSHMHFDHLGNVHRFSRVALADLPCLRAFEKGGVVTPSEEFFLGAWENLEAPAFKVSEWLAIEGEIDLGGRRLRILHTPGHSPDSVSLYEPGRDLFYAADFLYDGDLYAQVPGASLPEYLAIATSVREQIGDDTQILCAHGNVADGDVHSAPIMQRRDLQQLVAGLERVRRECLNWPERDEWRVPFSDRMGILISPQSVAQWRGTAQ